MDRIDYLVRASSGQMLSEMSSHPTQRPDVYIPGLRDTPWHDPRDFAFVRTVEASTGPITEELAALQRDAASFQPYREPGVDDESPSQIHDGAEWDISFLYFEGKRFQRNCRLAPRTTALFESLPGRAGLACFSRLSPKTHIQPHCAPSNAALRLHLGLIVPTGARIRVGEETRSWEAGRCLVFDHSFEHEIWGDPDQERIVLIMDFFHPDLSPDEVERLTARYHAASFEEENKRWLEIFGAAEE